MRNFIFKVAIAVSVVSGGYFGFVLSRVGRIEDITYNYQFEGKFQSVINLQLEKEDSLYELEHFFVEDQSVRKIKNGIIDSPQMAAQMADILIKSVYNESADLPITVKQLNNNVWLCCSAPPKAEGGSAHFLIRKQDAKVIYYCHGK